MQGGMPGSNTPASVVSNATSVHSVSIYSCRVLLNLFVSEVLRFSCPYMFFAKVGVFFLMAKFFLLFFMIFLFFFNMCLQFKHFLSCRIKTMCL